MNQKLPTLATLFAAGAFVAGGSAPLMAATAVTSHGDSALVEAGCGAKDAKDAKCGKDAKAKDAKCGKDAKAKDAKCGKDGKMKKDMKEPKKGEKDASCGKGSCGSTKKG